MYSSPNVTRAVVQNVLLKDLSGDGQAVLIDFETSKDMTIQQTATMTQIHGGAVGTLAYMAPERIAGLPGTTDTDRFSIGVVQRMVSCSGPGAMVFPVRVASCR